MALHPKWLTGATGEVPNSQTVALKFCVTVFVEVYSSAPRAPSFTNLGVYILRYLKSHTLALLEQDANAMHE